MKLLLYILVCVAIGAAFYFIGVGIGNHIAKKKKLNDERLRKHRK